MSNYFNSYNYNSSWNNPNNYDYTDVFEIKFVYCPLCSRKAHVKTNKKNKKMLRCDLCNALIFANGPDSQQLLLGLPEYQEDY